MYDTPPPYEDVETRAPSCATLTQPPPSSRRDETEKWRK
jgi:hypothetical protein